MLAVNLRQTAEVAALVATSAAHIVESQRPIPTAALHGYWKQSRTRLRCWFAALQTLRAPVDGTVSPSGLSRQSQMVALCRDILVTEMLTRIWSTVLLAADRRRTTDDNRAAVESVFRGHLEARQEVLKLLADDGALPLDEQISLDRFRRRIERWTDALIGPLLGAYGVGAFAFDERRAGDFAESVEQQLLRGASDVLTPLLLAGVKAGFPAGSDADRERSMLNLAIVRSILAAYPTDAFGSDGKLRSSRQAQVERSSRHAESVPSTEAAAVPGLNFKNLRRSERRDRAGE